MNGGAPRDAFSEPPRGGHRQDDWNPPVWARTFVWIVRDVGVPVTALAVLAAVLLGWLDSPLMKLRDVDARTAALVEAIHAHSVDDVAFQAALIEGMRKQRCISVLAQIADSAVASQAALATDPCVALETLRNRGR